MREGYEYLCSECFRAYTRGTYYQWRAGELVFTEFDEIMSTVKSGNNVCCARCNRLHNSQVVDEHGIATWRVSCRLHKIPDAEQIAEGDRDITFI